MRSDFQHLLVQQEAGVATLTMNRPEVLNAFNDLMLAELTEAVEEVARDEAVRCVILTGAGRAFGSGQDLSAFNTVRANGESVKVSEHLSQYHRLVLALQGMPKPVIAAVRGVAAGISCNIALACDLRVASDNARFVEAFARIGLVPDGGGGYFLPRLVGLGKALEMALLADEVSGAEAERIGLVNKCVPVEEFEVLHELPGASPGPGSDAQLRPDKRAHVSLNRGRPAVLAQPRRQTTGYRHRHRRSSRGCHRLHGEAPRQL